MCTETVPFVIDTRKPRDENIGTGKSTSNIILLMCYDGTVDMSRPALASLHTAPILKALFVKTVVTGQGESFILVTDSTCGIGNDLFPHILQVHPKQMQPVHVSQFLPMNWQAS